MAPFQVTLKQELINPELENHRVSNKLPVLDMQYIFARKCERKRKKCRKKTHLGMTNTPFSLPRHWFRSTVETVETPFPLPQLAVRYCPSALRIVQEEVYPPRGLAISGLGTGLARDEEVIRRERRTERVMDCIFRCWRVAEMGTGLGSRFVCDFEENRTGKGRVFVVNSPCLCEVFISMHKDQQQSAYEISQCKRIDKQTSCHNLNS